MHISVEVAFLLAVQVGSVVAVPSGDGLTEKTDCEVNPEASTKAKGSCGVLARLVADNPGVDHPCCLFLWRHLDTAHVGPEQSIPLSSWPDPLVHLQEHLLKAKVMVSLGVFFLYFLYITENRHDKIK